MGSKQKSLHASSWLRSRRGPLASSSGARRLIAGAVRESVQLEGQCRGAAALLPQHQPWPSDPVLAHFAWMTGSKRRPTHIARRRAEHGSNSEGLPRRADAISKAGVRRPDTGRVVCHERTRQRGPTLTVASTIHAVRAGRSPPTDRARRQAASRQSGTGAVSGARFSRIAITRSVDLEPTVRAALHMYVRGTAADDLTRI